MAGLPAPKLGLFATAEAPQTTQTPYDKAADGLPENGWHAHTE